MSVSRVDITNCLGDLYQSLARTRSMLQGMAKIAQEDESEGILLAMARTTEDTTHAALHILEKITDWCRLMDMQRIEREIALADVEETDDGAALRELARDAARQIQEACEPAMRAITHMQNRAGDIDAMVRRARDMAGCMRAAHSPDRDPDKPEVGSLRETVEEIMAMRPDRMAAAVGRLRARSAIDNAQRGFGS